jgi:hypothetical protein
MTVMESYVEHPPFPELAGVVRTVWIQSTSTPCRPIWRCPRANCAGTACTQLGRGALPAFDVAAAITDYVAWRTDSLR